MKQLTRFTIASIALSAVLQGCYTTTIRSGKPAEQPSVEYDEKWHHGLVWGIAELSGPYDLQRICPNGWSVIKTETSFVNGVVEAVTSGIYSPQTVTVQCARPGASASAARTP
ncbi:MAG TPA: Bor family protein [Polyangiaceae bacterium]|nr:Bor family protein [Polyangiaceae bacterium]